MTPPTKMQLKSMLAYAVLLTSSAFDTVVGGGPVALWHQPLGHFPPRTAVAFSSRCSDGLLTCSKGGYKQYRPEAALGYRGGEYGIKVSPTLQVIPQDFVQDHVGDLVAGAYQVRSVNITQRHEPVTLPDMHTLEPTKEQLFPSVPARRFTSEKQPSSAIGDTNMSGVAEDEIKGSDVLERGPATAESPGDALVHNALRTFLNPQAWMMHARSASSLLIHGVLASLRHAVKAVIRSKAVSEIGLPTFYGGSMDILRKASTHCEPLVGRCQFPSQPLYNDTCPAAVAPRRAFGCPRGSFLHEPHEPEMSDGRHRAGACLQKEGKVLRARARPVQYYVGEHKVGEPYRVLRPENEYLQQQIFHRPGVEERSFGRHATQLQMPFRNHTEAGPRDAYSLLEMWGERREPTQSTYNHQPQRSAADLYSNIQVREHNRLLKQDSLVTITYHFPFQTAESQSIAFILVALPPGYMARDNNLCQTHDFNMPALSCRLRHVDLPDRESGLEAAGNRRTFFVQVSSADNSRELPLGTHSFSVAVRNPAHRLAVGLPRNWWFVTFRFSAGHTVTKHFENGLLHEKRNCAWTSWRQETPCSASCGPGFEMWTRSLLAGDDGVCGPEIVKKRCELVPCNINCQLGPWQTVIDCTKPCLAQKDNAFQVSVRPVLLNKQGSGVGCEHLYPWDEKLKQGWSDKLHLVVRRSPCHDIFAQVCPADLGCRVERRSNRTITVGYPWGSCPFPCGGIGRITSIIQVANGIPRWIGEREYPSSFQAPCRADKEPIVRRQRCNTFACEDCSIYLEAPTERKALRAWFFFLPSQAADIVTLTIPPGSTFALDDEPGRINKDSAEGTTIKDETHAAGDRKAATYEDTQPSTASGEKWEELDAVLNHRSLPAGPTPEQTVEDIITEHDKEEGAGTTRWSATKETGSESHFPGAASLCGQLRASFGQLSQCYVRASARYQMSQELVFQLKQPIAPHFSTHVHTSSQQSAGAEALTPRRPEWLVVPLRLNDKMSTDHANKFHMWLTSSHMPRDPEVFTCRVKTPMGAPVNCQYTYSPVYPEDCNNCIRQSSLRILMFRQFSPPKNGGTCHVPQERWQPGVVLVVTACPKGCAHVRRNALEKKGSMPPSGRAAGTQGDTRVFSSVSSGSRRFDQRQNSPRVASSKVHSILSLRTRKAAVYFPGHGGILEDV